jgi:hypothetical protein
LKRRKRRGWITAVDAAVHDQTNDPGVLSASWGEASAGVTVGATGCTDVQSGGNKTATIGGFSAGPGYDAVTGWGTPNGRNLLEVLSTVLPAPPGP